MIYVAKPLEVTLDGGKYEKANQGGLTFIGFLGEKKSASQCRLITGTGTMLQLDSVSLDFEMTFTSKGLLMDMGRKVDSIVVSGNMEVTLDNAVDARTTK